MNRSSMIQVTFLSILAIFAMSASTSRADFLVNDTFDADPTGKLPDGWIVRTGDAEAVQVVEQPSATNKSLEIDGTGGRIDLDRAFEPQTGVFTVEVDFMSVIASGNVSMPYVGKEGATNGGFSVCFILFGKDISYHNGGWIRGTIGNVEEGKWYHFKAVADVKAQQYDLYFDNKEIVKGAAFRGAADSLSIVDFGGGAGGYQYLIDNLMVYEGTERPKPTSVNHSGKLASTWADIRVIR